MIEQGEREGAVWERVLGWAPLRAAAWYLASLLAMIVAFRLALPRAVPFGILFYGVVIGAINALIAVGLILIYRANRIINFALAEIGIFGAILFEQLVRKYDVPWVFALVAGVAAAGVLGGVLEYVFVRRFAKAPRLILTVVTIGLAQVVAVLQFAESQAFGRFAAPAGLKTPFSDIRFTVTRVVFDGNALVLLAAVPLMVLALDLFLRRTDFGVAVRAAAENGDRASLLGVPVKRVSTAVWVIAAVFTALATILRAPIVGLVSGSLAQGPGLLLRALAAAVIARLVNTRTAVVAALLIGVTEQALFYAYAGSTISDAVFVGVIIVALLVQRPRAARADQGSETWAAVEEVRAIPAELRSLPEVRRTRVGVAVALVAAVVVFPLVSSDADNTLASVMAIYALVAVSLVILTGWSGQISLGQFAVVGFGAAVAGRLAADFGWDTFAVLLAAAATGAVVSLALGLAALRLRGYFFAVTTLGFAVATSTFFLNEKFFSGLLPKARPERPILFGSIDLEGEAAYYYFCVVVLALAMAAVRALRRSRTGRVLVAMRDNPQAAQSYGINEVRAKLLTFALSGCVAGLAGALWVFHQRAVSPAAFLPAESLKVFSMVVIGGLGSLPGAVLGAVFVRGAGSMFSPQIALLTSGIGLLAVLMLLPGGLGRLVFDLRDGLLRRVARRRRLVVPSLLADVRVEDDDARAEHDYEAARRRASASLSGAATPESA